MCWGGGVGRSGGCGEVCGEGKGCGGKVVCWGVGKVREDVGSSGVR